MTAAAAELGVTHGAISRGIRALQLQMGVSLVEGPRHALRLTPAGRKLAEAASAGFALIAEAVPGVMAHEELVLSCYGTLAMKWLIPRLPDFLKQHPGARVRILEEHGPVDFARGHIQAAIRLENAVPPGARALRFMANFQGPVLSPSLWDACGGGLNGLLRLDRLVSETFISGWEEWSSGTGIALPEPTAIRTFEHNSYLLEAAKAGLGVAITLWGFAEADITAGRLIAPLGFRLLPHRFTFIRPGVGEHPLAAAFGRWLQQQGRLAALPPPFKGAALS